MSAKTIPVEDLGARTLAEVLEQVALNQQALTVILAGGDAVEIRPGGRLKPLPELEGSIPAGWKEAIGCR